MASAGKRKRPADSALYAREDQPLFDLDLLLERGVQTIPFDYQLSMIAFCCSNKNVLCCDDMGLGKTCQSICVMRADPPTPAFLGSKTRLRGHTLVVCPKIVMQQWIDQYALHTNAGHGVLHHGDVAERGSRGASLAEQASRCDVPAGRDALPYAKSLCEATMVVTTYDRLRSEFNADVSILHSIQWWRVVMDEAHVVRNGGTQQFKAVDALECTRRLVLTGTPLHNTVNDLFPVVRFFRLEGFAGTLLEAQARWERMVPLQKHKRRNRDADEAVRALVTPYLIRRVKGATWNGQALGNMVSQKRHHTVTVKMSKEHDDLYNDLQAQARTCQEWETNAWVMRLRVASANPPAAANADHIPAPKPPHALELLRDGAIAKREKAVVFSCWKSSLNALQELLSQEQVATMRIDGGTSQKNRDLALEAFRQAPESAVLLMTLSGVSIGLNLTEARHVIFMDPHWNPCIEAQAEDRVFRIGQTSDVHITRMLLARHNGDSTIEHVVARVKARKGRMARDFLET